MLTLRDFYCQRLTDAQKNLAAYEKAFARRGLEENRIQVRIWSENVRRYQAALDDWDRRLAG